MTPPPTYGDAYILRCLSPLHAGSGDTTYGVIDKQVQRDATTGLPLIHSSSLKGALREYFSWKLEQGAFKPQKQTFIDAIFGPEADERKKLRDTPSPSAQAMEKGAFHFDFAYLLSLPLRCDRVPYVSATSRELLEEAVERLKLYGYPENEGAVKVLGDFLAGLESPAEYEPWLFSEGLGGAIFEDPEIRGQYREYTDIANVELLLGKNIVVMAHSDFSYLAEKLPVIARNRLDNGISRNLWYEELVPRESRFLTFIGKLDRPGPDGQAEITLRSMFDGVLAHRSIVQVGGNATVGYGQTQFLYLSSLLSNPQNA